MDYKPQEYRRIGPLFYPVRFLTDGSIEVVNEPKNEREIRDMIIEEQFREVEDWERRGLLPKI